MAGETGVLEENPPAAVVKISGVVPARTAKDALQKETDNCTAANELHLRNGGR
jgi:hypothetical protein